jgi:hypothetical protein
MLPVMKMHMHVGLPTMSVLVDMGAEEPHSEEDDHQCDQKFKRVGNPLRNSNAQAHNQNARHKQGRRMSGSPEYADAGRLPEGSALAHNRRDGRQVIGFGSVPESEYEAKSQRCEDRFMHGLESIIAPPSTPQMESGIKGKGTTKTFRIFTVPLPAAADLSRIIVV